LKTTIVFLLFLLIDFRLYAQHSGCHLTIRGQVIDSSHTEPLDHADIELIGSRGLSASTDIKGYFELKGVCAGRAELHISHRQCEHIHIEVDIISDTFLTIYLRHIEQEMQDIKVVVKTGRQEQLGSVNARQLESRKGSAIALAMQDIGGVSLLRTGSNAIKPIVNGLHSNRVIIINNGIRQEGQNWGMEHAPEIDAFLATNIELLKGAEALRYAPDGIGGVILIRPSSIFNEKQDRISGEINTVFASNGRIGTVSGFAGSRLKKAPFYWRVQGTLKQGGNTRTPDYFMANTAMHEVNYSANAGYRIKNLKTEVFYSDFRNKIGIFSGAHAGNLSDLQQAIASDRPLVNAGFSYKIGRPYQFVTHQLLKLRNDYSIDARNHLEITLSLQRNHRQEFDLLRSSTAFTGPSFNYYINSYIGDAVWVRNNIHAFNFKAGVTGIYQANAYTGRFFIPGFYQKGLASYFTGSRSVKRMTFEGALRYDIRQMKAYLFNGNILNIKTLNFNDVTYLIQMDYRVNRQSKITLIHGSAWRPPAPNELFANGLHQGLASIEIGDSSMTAERSFNQSLGYALKTDHFQFETELYYKYILGFINLLPSIQPQLTIRGAFPVFRYTQSDAAIYGLNFMLKKMFGKYLYAKTAANILAGYQVSPRQPLSQMPPWSGKTSIGIDKKNLSLQVYIQYAASQFRYMEASDYKAPPKAYALAGMEASWQFSLGKQPVKLNVSIMNLSNTRYREYLNRFRYFTDEQGFNLITRIIIPLNISK
jgi:iron complex outermembrane receptor protein